MTSDEKRDALYEYAIKSPDGFTFAGVEREFGWKRGEFFRVVRTLRLHLAEDEINLPCSPQGSGEMWLYRLDGTEGGSEDWVRIRMHDSEARLGTIEAVAGSAARCSDPRSVEGLKARRIHSTISYLRRELEHIDGSVSTT